MYILCTSQGDESKVQSPSYNFFIIVFEVRMYSSLVEKLD